MLDKSFTVWCLKNTPPPTHTPPYGNKLETNVVLRYVSTLAMYHFPLLTVTTSRKLKYTSIFASSAPVHKTTFSLRNGQMQL